MFKKLLGKIFGAQEDEIFSSLPVSAWKQVHQKYSFSDYLPYSSYSETENLFYNNDGTAGFCFEVIPRTRSAGSTAAAINEILGKMPEGVFLQCHYYGSKNIKSDLDEFIIEHSVRGRAGKADSKIVQDSIEAMAQFLRNKTNSACSEDMHAKLRKIRIIFSVVSTGKVTKEMLINFKQDLSNILQSNSFYPAIINASKLFEYGYELLNPAIEPEDYPNYNDSKYINKQIVSSGSDFQVDDDSLTLSNKRTWINLTPQSFSQHFHIWEFGQKLGDYLSESLNSNQFKDNFIISVTIMKKDASGAKRATRNHAVIANQNWGENIFRKFAAVKKESVMILDRIDEKKEELFEFDMDVLVSGKNYSEASLNAQAIESYWGRGGEGRSKIMLDRTKGIHHLAFLSALPMAMNIEYFHEIGGKFRTLFSNQAAHIFPMEADYRGEGRNLPLITRRANLAFLDLYASNTNFNGFVVATSGAGKSVFLNMLAYMSYARGDRIFILDYDNSFTGLIDSIDGQYLELNPEIKAISFNPFSGIQSREELIEELPYLSSFIYLLGSSKSTTRAEEDEKLIKTELQQIILKQYEIAHEKLEITFIRDAIMKEYAATDTRFSDFARQLGQYCRNGMYEKWFSGPCEFSMDKDMMAVEFKGVDAHEDLRDPLVMLLLYHIGKVMYSTDPNKPRIQIILDEAHRFLGKNKRMDDFIDQAYRRARKFNGSMIIATQGFDDIYSASGGLSRAGSTIMNNSANKIFLKQTSTSTNLMINADLFGFDSTDEKLLRSIKTRKREYSEMFFISPDDMKSVFRLIMPKFFYYLSTTDQQDKKKIQEYMDVYELSKMEAINKLVEHEENPVGSDAI